MGTLTKTSLIILSLGAALGTAIGVGWGLWGDVKAHFPVVLLGFLGGAALAFPIIAYVIIDAQRWPIWRKAATSLVPLFLLSFCVPFYGGPVMFLQLCAILVPGFLVTRAWATFLVSVLGGFAFLRVWYLLSVVQVVPRSDNIFVFYPFAIGVVSVIAAIGRAISRRCQRRRAASEP